MPMPPQMRVPVSTRVAPPRNSLPVSPAATAVSSWVATPMTQPTPGWTLRALNPGSVGLPGGAPGAAWMIIDADETGVTVEHRRAPFDVECVARDLRQRRSAGAAFVTSTLRREHLFAY